MQSKLDKIAREAPEQDVCIALVSLNALPTRDSDHADLDLAAYNVALEGIVSDTLATAVRRILQGSLGHGFFPSPPELRIECNRIIQTQADEHARQLRQSRLREEVVRHQIPQHSPEERNRVQKIYEKFCRSDGATPGQQ